MRLVTTTLFLLLILSLQIYAQNTRPDYKVSAIYFEKDSSFTKVSFRNNSTSALFKIVLKGMETEKKRKEAIQKHREVGLPFPMFYYTFIGGEPERISSLNGIDYITTSEFQNTQPPVKDTLIIIQKLRGGDYLKWKAIFMPYQ